jgi:hypothetical protein
MTAPAIQLARFDEMLTKDINVLKVSTIDENLVHDSPDRKSEADVLEIFVRVNREGTPLQRSDLIFSMLKLNWRESAENLPEFLRAINRGNSLEIDEDFVIRCLLAVSDLGAKLNIDLFRKKSTIDVQANFEQCCDAIRSTVDFTTNQCSCFESA